MFPLSWISHPNETSEHAELYQQNLKVLLNVLINCEHWVQFPTTTMQH